MSTSDPPYARLKALAEKNGWPTRIDPLLEFQEPKLRALLALWLEKAAGGVPARAAFDMRTLKPFLTHVLILERVASDRGRRYKFRLFGSALQLLFGEHTGHHLDEAVSPDMLDSWLSVYDEVLATHLPLRIVTRFRTSTSFLEGEIFAAPVVGSSGEENEVLAATYVDAHDIVLPQFG